MSVEGAYLAQGQIRSHSRPPHSSLLSCHPLHLLVASPHRDQHQNSHIFNIVTESVVVIPQIMDHVFNLITRAGAAETNGTGAPPQAGILEGANPSKYTPSNPITLFIIQVR